MRTKRVVVLPYEEAWRTAFEEIKSEIEAEIGDLVLGIEHVGSTSVEGMSAKPCIDMDVIIKDYSVFIAPCSDSDEQFSLVNDYFSGYCIINCLNEIIPDCTPEGTCQLFLTSMTHGDVMRDIRPQDYKKFKTKVAKDMIETCEKALNISITPYIEEIEIALPPTFCRYLNTPLGTPYGYFLDKWDSMIPRTIQYMKDQPFDNFLFCGATQERGDGYGCAYHTGEKAGNLTVKAFKEGK